MLFTPPPLKIFGYCLTVPSVEPPLSTLFTLPPTRTSCYMYACSDFLKTSYNNSILHIVYQFLCTYFRKTSIT